MNERIQSVLDKLEKQETFEQQNHHAIPFSQKMLAITPKIGKFYNILLRGTKSTRILEIGTSVGYSTIWFAEAIRDMPDSKIITIDSDAKKIQRAKKNFEDAGVADIILQRHGPALDVISQLQEKFDFVFIDADKENYVQYFDAVFPMIKVGGLIGADNILFPERYRDMISVYLNHIRNNPKVISETIPIDNGEELTLKLRD